MIEKMATDFIMQMTENKPICKEMEERYIYAFICMVEKIITIGSIVVIGLITHNLLPTILFLIFFWELRKRTGGYHLDKFYKCYLATVASCLIVMIIGTNLVEHIQILLGILAIATVYIEIVGTVNHPNMQMNSTELAESKKIARIVVLLECSIILGCVLLNANKVYVSYMAIAVILCAVLLCISKILRQEVIENEENQQKGDVSAKISWKPKEK